MRIAKFAVLACGALAITVGLAFRDANIAWMVGLAFSIAASTFFPLLLMGIWWRRMTEQGAFWGLLVGGGISAVVVIGKLAGLWEVEQPAIVSVPAAFLTIYLVSMATQRTNDGVWEKLEEAFHALHRPELEIMKRQETMAATETAATAEMPVDDQVETIPHQQTPPDK
jgi:Na+(H+)/acetate symporter ActP